jgi:two-component system NtrC family sensor kinase
VDLKRVLTDALEQQTATSQILRMISQSPTDVQPVFDAIAQNAARLCEAQFCFVYRFDGQVLHFVAHHGVTNEGVEGVRRAFPAPPSRGSAAARAILDCSVAQIPDVRVDSDFALRPAAMLAGYRSAVAVPMMRSGLPIGAIAVGRAQTGLFPDRQVNLLQTFADQAVIAIENVRLFAELQQKNEALTLAHAQVSESLEQQTATAEILRVTSSSPTNLQPVLDAIAENAAKVCNARDAVLFRLEGDTLRIAAQYGTIPASGVEQLLSVDRGWVTGRAVVDRRTIHVDDLAAASETEFPKGRERAQRFGHRTTLATPLLREGVALGAILIRRMEVQPFTDKQITLLETFADQAVIAIENVRLFKELEARNRDLTESLEQQTATSEILRVISSSPTDVQPVFDTIIQSAVRLCGARIGALYRFDGELLHLAAHHNVGPDVLATLLRLYPMRPNRETASGRAILGRAVAELPDVSPTRNFDTRSRLPATGEACSPSRCSARAIRSGRS